MSTVWSVAIPHHGQHEANRSMAQLIGQHQPSSTHFWIAHIYTEASRATTPPLQLRGWARVWSVKHSHIHWGFKSYPFSPNQSISLHRKKTKCILSGVCHSSSIKIANQYLINTSTPFLVVQHLTAWHNCVCWSFPHLSTTFSSFSCSVDISVGQNPTFVGSIIVLGRKKRWSPHIYRMKSETLDNS